MNSKTFREVVLNHWKKNGRHDLPWRKTTDPYKILVSEMMLQQTQVERVVPKYKEFVEKFPTAGKLAAAPLSDVLKLWSGLGYNRRAKYLHDAARSVKGNFPRDYDSLRKLPGVGDYTAKAVRVFAFNEPEALIETNIRTALIHHFGGTTPTVCYSIVLGYAEKMAKGQDPREWHSALMDYGAHLKRNGVRNNARSAQYVKQSRFEGSLRQVRGEILRKLMSGEFEKRRVYAKALESLERDGLIVSQKGEWRVV